MKAVNNCSFNVSKEGLHALLKKTAYLTAAPDGLFLCNCHRRTVIKIKCPHMFKTASRLQIHWVESFVFTFKFCKAIWHKWVKKFVIVAVFYIFRSSHSWLILLMQGVNAEMKVDNDSAKGTQILWVLVSYPGFFGKPVVDLVEMRWHHCRDQGEICEKFCLSRSAKITSLEPVLYTSCTGYLPSILLWS